jgi:class 3 adenylate cyclase
VRHSAGPERLRTTDGKWRPPVQAAWLLVLDEDIGAENEPLDDTRPLPTGTTPFLFTDIEGSPRLWEQAPGAMHVVLAHHNERPADGSVDTRVPVSRARRGR